MKHFLVKILQFTLQTAEAVYALCLKQTSSLRMTQRAVWRWESYLNVANELCGETLLLRVLHGCSALCHVNSHLRMQHVLILLPFHRLEENGEQKRREKTKGEEREEINNWLSSSKINSKGCFLFTLISQDDCGLTRQERGRVGKTVRDDRKEARVGAVHNQGY